MRIQLLMLVAVSMLALGACKNGSIFSKKKQTSDATGWNYNDKNQGGYNVVKPKDIKAGPGLVFVQGGTFVMGATEEDVMADWNNVPKRITVNSFFIDRTEVANVHYREYLFWLNRVFDPQSDPANQQIVDGAYPDTLVWRSELAFNEPYVEYYFRHPSFNYYPVVGVTWRQAYDFCLWRTDRVNELELLKGGFINKNEVKNLQGKGADAFNTKAYLLGLTTPAPGTAGKSKKNPFKTPEGRPRTQIVFEDGVLTPDYRLPTEAEWEYAALAYIGQNPQPRRKEKARGEELVANKQIYSWNNNYNGLRDNRRGSWQGEMLANFKRASGDMMGVAGGLNDRAATTAPVQSFWPNSFGLYNMSGNVSEWVGDVYRPTTFEVGDDFNYYRGNTFKKNYVADPTSGDPSVRYEKDSVGRVKQVNENDEDLKKRRNYQKFYAIDYLDGDSLSGASYGYGKTTLVSDSSRVVKGGSWMDRPYWLGPGTRRFLEESQSSSTIGFRCAMTFFGSPEGNGTRTGNHWATKRQRR
jgi:gliding motility-associated lipoprotein GldJ